MSSARRNPIRRAARLILIVGVVYACWLGMMLVHEFGHALHAWISGGKVAHVALPLLGFSRTELSENPHPLFVACGGAVWGCLLPGVLLGIWWVARVPRRRLPLFFAGFCLIANGAYLAFGSLLQAGDANDVLRLGTPRWVVILLGAIALIAGLYLWHLLGQRFGLNNAGKS